MTWSMPIDDEGGFVVIDKPKGPTSHQIDYWVREITGIKKVGHVGTLDPQATGVLVMALGKSTRLIDVAHEQPKEYVGIMKLHGEVERDRLEEAFKEFTGEIIQLPPMRSAVARRLRTRRVYEIELIEVVERNVLFRVKCESGTYIRTLCVDIGYVLGTGANMIELRRTRSGVFTEDQCVSLQDLSDAIELSKAGKENTLKSMFHDATYLFRENAKIVVKDSSIQNISRGSDLYPGGIRKIIGEPMKGDRVMVSSESGKFLGTGTMLANFMDISDLKIVDFDRIMVDPDPLAVRISSESPDNKSIENKHGYKDQGKRVFTLTSSKTQNKPYSPEGSEEQRPQIANKIPPVIKEESPRTYNKSAPPFSRGKSRDNTGERDNRQYRSGPIPDWKKKKGDFQRNGREQERKRPQFQREFTRENHGNADRPKNQENQVRQRTFPSEEFPRKVVKESEGFETQRKRNPDERSGGYKQNTSKFNKKPGEYRKFEKSTGSGNYSRDRERKEYPGKERSERKSGFGGNSFNRKKPSFDSYKGKSQSGFRENKDQYRPSERFGSGKPMRKGKKHDSRDSGRRN